VDKKMLVAPILCVGVGVGWLLTALGFVPGVNWAWTIGLGVVGVIFLILGGLNKFTVVVSPFLSIASIFSLLRQTGRMETNVETPSLVIAGGLCLLLPYLVKAPNPSWYKSEANDAVPAAERVNLRQSTRNVANQDASNCR
jgi:hypothetical protein